MPIGKTNSSNIKAKIINSVIKELPKRGGETVPVMRGGETDEADIPEASASQSHCHGDGAADLAHAPGPDARRARGRHRC